MISNTKRLCLALAIALGSAGMSAAQTPPANQDQLRQELRDAQKQLAEIGRRVAELSAQIGGDPAQVQMFRYLGNPDRAVIGVILGDGSASGVRVEGVTPGGPAEKAGLQAGDTITGVRGASIKGERPTLALREALKDLKDGDKVSLSFARDGKSQSVDVVAARQGNFDAFASRGGPGFVFESRNGETITFPPEMDPEIQSVVERAMHDAEGLRLNVMSMSALGGLHLTAVNQELGRYFGASEGVLVLEVDSELYPDLQAGDVILEIDGKAVKDSRDAMREMSRQDPSRQVELKLLRDRVPQLVKISMLDVLERSRAFMAPPAPPATPRPPSPMSAPRAPTPSALPHPSAAPTPTPPPPAQSAMI